MRPFDNNIVNNNNLNDQMIMNAPQQQFNNNTAGMNNLSAAPAQQPVSGVNNMNMSGNNNMEQFMMDKPNDASLDLISGDFDFIQSIDTSTPTGAGPSIGMDDAYLSNKSTGFDDLSYGYQPMMMQGQPSPMKPQLFGQEGGFNDQQYQNQPMHSQQMAPGQSDFGLAQQQQPGRFNQYAQPMNQQQGSSLKLLLD